MNCPKCNFQNPDGIKFCGECGSKLEKLCPKCGFSNPPKFKFCGECGEKFDNSINLLEPKSYTPNHLADKILTTRSSIEGERKLVTVLFADVANYTCISERLDPEEVHLIMDGCFKILIDEIHKYEGTINQFTGDGVMALFGAPLAHEDHAQRACRSAISIQIAFKKYKKELQEKFNIQFELRIGINSGLVVVGSIGDDLRMDYTAVGDTTNLAARMESHAKPGSILLSQKTKRIVEDFFELEFFGEIKVKGKEKPQKAYQLIRTGNIETRIGASQLKGFTRFVGRKESMKMLLDCYTKANEGTGQVIGIVGEAGVGKSRLLIEMKKNIPQENYEYIEGRCLQYGRSILYLPILDIIRSVFKIKDDDQEFIVKRRIKEVLSYFGSQFNKINPAIEDILSLKVDNTDFRKLEPKDKREVLFEGIRDLLLKISQHKTLVLAIEDLHWIDKASEEFIQYFMDWIATAKVLLLLLYRPEYTHQWGSKTFYTKIGVDQLSLDSSGKLVHAILEEGSVAPELNQLILNRSSGNPLFMEEFTHTLIENGSIEKYNNQYRIKGNLENIKVPDTIQGIIAARIDRLEDNLKRTLQVASVIGRDFAFRILQTITGMQAELKSYLLNLQGLEFIYEKKMFPELEYIFKHALTQEVAYRSLLQLRRKEIHNKIGEAIERLYPQREEEFFEILSFHYLKAENYKYAFKYLKKSATKCLHKFSLKESNDYYLKAYKIFDEKIHSSEDLIGLLVAWGNVLHLNGAYEKLIKIFEKHEQIANSLPQSKMVGTFYSWLGIAFQCQEKLKDSKKYLLIAKNIGKKINDDTVLGYAYSGLSYTLSDIGEIDNAIICGEKATKLCISNPMESELMHLALSGLAYSYYFKGNVQETYNTAKLLIEYGTKRSNHRCKIMGFVFSGAAEILNGDYEAALNKIQKGCNISSDPLLTNSAKFWLGYNCILLNRFNKAEKLLKEVLDFSLDSGAEYLKTSVIGLQGILDIVNGNFAKGFAKINDIRTDFKSKDSKYRHAALELMVGQIYSSLIKKDKKTSIDFLMVVKNFSFLLTNIPHAFEKAEKHLLSAVQISEQLGAKSVLGQSHLELGYLYKSKRKKIQSMENANIALNIFIETDAQFYIAQTEKLISQL
jgi:class 3 adenylate cyclase/tetratricopeptide (TPR) repeat protein